MYALFKVLRGMIKAIGTDAAPWQLALGAFLGTLIGFLPIFPLTHGPAPLGLCCVALVVVLNCHLGAALLFWGAGALAAKLLHGPALALGDACAGLAQWAAGVPFLHASLWSHTGWLGLTLIGLAAAPFFALIMRQFTLWFRARMVPLLAERRRLALAGKIGGNPILVRIACWFFGI